MASMQTDPGMKITWILTFAAILIAVIAMLQVKLLRGEIEVMRNDVNTCLPCNCKVGTGINQVMADAKGSPVSIFPEPGLQDADNPDLSPPSDGFPSNIRAAEDSTEVKKLENGVQRPYGNGQREVVKIRKGDQQRHDNLYGRTETNKIENGDQIHHANGHLLRVIRRAVSDGHDDVEKALDVHEDGRSSNYLKNLVKRDTPKKDKTRHGKKKGKGKVSRKIRELQKLNAQTTKRLKEMEKKLKVLNKTRQKLNEIEKKLKVLNQTSSKGVLFETAVGLGREPGVVGFWQYALGTDDQTKEAFTLGGLESHLGRVTVKYPGLYFAFAQFTYSGNGTKEFDILTETDTDHRIIAKCMQVDTKIPDGSEMNSCYSGSLVKLEANERVFVSNVAGQIHFKSKMSYFGLIRL